MRGVVARNGGRYGVKEGDRTAYRRQANRRKHDLPKAMCAPNALTICDTVDYIHNWR